MIIKYAVIACLTIGAGSLETRAEASPRVQGVVARAAQVADIPFDPPIDAALRYRWEKAVVRGGQTRMSWSVSDFDFDRMGEGYRLTVTPVTSGSNESDPGRLAMEKKLEKLLNFPFVLRLDSNGLIQELVDADRYWSTILKVLAEELERSGAKSGQANWGDAVKGVIGMFEKMPAEARLGLLTESVQPMLEFGATRTEIGKPIATDVEGASPFGGTLKRKVTINLTKIDKQLAFLTVRTTVPRAELDALTAGFVTALGKLPADKQETMRKGLASLRDFRHETNSDYRVSLDDGILDKYQSTETVTAAAEGKSDVRTTTRSLERIN